MKVREAKYFLNNLGPEWDDCRLRTTDWFGDPDEVLYGLVAVTDGRKGPPKYVELVGITPRGEEPD